MTVTYRFTRMPTDAAEVLAGARVGTPPCSEDAEALSKALLIFKYSNNRKCRVVFFQLNDIESLYGSRFRI